MLQKLTIKKNPFFIPNFLATHEFRSGIPALVREFHAGGHSRSALAGTGKLL